MSELATYSIETDHVVLLVFTDGRRKRVPIDELRHYLSVKDLATVRAGLKLRRHFLHHHMPKAAFALAAGGAMAMLAVTAHPLAAWWTGATESPLATPGPHSELVRSLPDVQTSGQGTPSPAPATPAGRQAVAVRASPTPKPRRATKPTANPVSRPIIAANIAPGATNGVAPVPTLAVPLPLLTPTPTPPPNAGQVLGDSTGPDDPTPTPQPGPVPTPAPTPTPDPSP